jgi:hypothetical protein
MFEMFKTREYLLVALISLAVFLMLLINPVGLRNRNFDIKGTECPNPTYHALTVLMIGTVIYLFLTQYSCTRNA